MRRTLLALLVVAASCGVLVAAGGQAAADTPQNRSWTTLQNNSTPLYSATPHPDNLSVVGLNRSGLTPVGINEYSAVQSNPPFRTINTSQYSKSPLLDISPDGSMVAFRDGTIYDYQTGGVIQQLPSVEQPEFSPSGDYLIDRLNATVWDTNTWTVVFNPANVTNIRTMGWTAGGNLYHGKAYDSTNNTQNISIHDPANGFSVVNTHNINYTNSYGSENLYAGPSGGFYHEVENYSANSNNELLHYNTSTDVVTKIHNPSQNSIFWVGLSADRERLAIISGGGSFDKRATIYLTHNHSREANIPVHRNAAYSIWGHQSDILAVSGSNTYETLTHQPVIEGWVTNASGAPLAGANISAQSMTQTVQTNSSGYYQYPVPDPGNYSIQMRYRSNKHAGVMKSTYVPSSGTVLNFTQVQTYGFGVAGYIFDEAGAPIANASVELNGTTFYSDTSGFYVAGATTNDTYDIDYNKPGYKRYTEPNFQIGANLPINNVTLQWPNGTLISGHVYDIDTGDPVTGATVATGFQQTTSDVDGEYQLQVSTNGLWQVTAANAIDSDAQVVNATGNETTANFYLKTNNTAGTGSLWVRSEQTGELINNHSVEINVFGNTTSSQFNTSTGVFHFSRVNQTEPVVITAHAQPEFETRRIIVDDLSTDNNLFLLENAEVSGAFFTEFQLEDLTGEFSDRPRLYIERSMPLPGESTDIPYRVLLSDFFGSDEQIGLLMEADARHRIIIENTDGDIRELGSYTATRERTVPLQIADIEWDLGNHEDVVLWDARRLNVSGHGDSLRFQLNDSGNRTTNLRLKMYETGNESRMLYNRSHAGPFGNISILQPIWNNATNVTSWTIEWNATRGFKDIGATKIVGPAKYDPDVDSEWFEIFGMLLLVFVAGMFSVRLAAVGAVITPLLALLLWTMGWLPVPVSWVLAAIVLGVMAEFANRGGFSDKP